MRCAECGFYECALRSPLGGCLNGEKAEQAVVSTIQDTRFHDFYKGPCAKDYEPADTMKKKAMLCKWYSAGECKKGLPGTKCELTKCVAWEESKVSVYDLGLGGIEIMEEQYKKLADAAKSLVGAVEGYVCPKKGDKYVFRGEVLARCNELKKLLNETE